MSDIEQIDFSTLIWVKKELDETFKKAQVAIEEYVENPEDENQLQFCATYLHQIQGTLKMVELYGAAMVAEEMEQVVKKILNKEVDSEKDSFEVLMRGIILLPDYLERIQLGYKDIPMVLLPLVNDLRTVKGDQLLSESALFNPDLSLGLPEANLRSNFTLSQNQLVQVVKKIRSAYQICLLNWLKNKDVKANLKKIQIIVDKLKTVITPVQEKQLFWVAGGLFEALINDGLEQSVTVKQLGAKLDQSIRMIAVPESKDDSYYKELTNNLLYYVALSDSKDRRINEIQQFFNLSNFISDDKEIEHAQSSLSGKNRELLESVTSVIKEDLMTIQEGLDLYNRNEDATTSDLGNIIDSMRKISDTLGIIGIGIAREKIRDDITIMEAELNTKAKLDNDKIMHIAETLLYVESSLDENIQLLGKVKEKDPNQEEKAISSTEMKKIMDTLAKESILNLQKIKHNFVQFIEEPWKKETIESSPKLLKEISGALNMSGYKDVADQIDKIELYTSKYMLDTDYKPTVSQLNLLAESIASLEYYLEYLSDGIKGEERILELAKTNIISLFESIELAEQHKKQPENIDADLDNMSDDDFELGDEFDIDSDKELDIEFDLGEPDEKNLNNTFISLDDEETDYDKGELHTNNEDLSVEEIINDNEIIDDVKEHDLSISERAETPGLYVTFSEETDDDIKEVFTEELEEELEHLNSIFPRWLKNPDEQMELLGEMRRIYHTLKGSGRLVGALAIGDFSWRIEDMTNLVLNDNQKLNDSYILVMKKSKEILPGLVEALQNEALVPEGYYRIIEAAELVIDGNEVAPSFFDKKILDSVEKIELIENEPDGINQSEALNNSDEDSVSEGVNIEDQVEEDKNDSNENDLTVDPVFVEILQQEVEGHLNEISEFINNSNITGNSKSTDKFIRIVHTLNGAANMASVKSIVEMTTPLELAAKLTNELEEEFDDASLNKILEFSQEASNIMKDLNNKSDCYDATNELNLYFTQLLEKLEGKKSAIEFKDEDELSSEINLSDYLDDNIDDNLDHEENIEVLSEVDFEEFDFENDIDDLETDENIKKDSIEIDELIEIEDVSLEPKSDEPIDFDELDIGDNAFEFDLDDDSNKKLNQKKVDVDIEETLLEMDFEETDLELKDFSEDVDLEDSTDLDKAIDLGSMDEELKFSNDDLSDLEVEDILNESSEIDALIDLEELNDLDKAIDLEAMDEELELLNEELEEDSINESSDNDTLIDINLEDDASESIEEIQDPELEVIEFDLNTEDDEFLVDEILIDSTEEKENQVDGLIKEVEDTLEVVDGSIEDDIEMAIADTSDDNIVHISASISTSYDEVNDSDHDMSVEFDEELLEIFKEEADDILDRTEHVLSELEENPKDSSQILALQRDLHTLKGGARMAGLENIGNISHVLESLLEIIGEENRNVDSNVLSTVHESFDLLNKMKDQKDFGESLDVQSTLDRLKNLIGLEDNIIPEESKLDLDYLAPVDPILEIQKDEIEVVGEEQSTARKSNVLSGNQIKVRSELLDNLVNYAGEVSIYRSRLEQEVGSFRVNLSELGNTVSRIKDQLRKLDAETEAQIISTFHTEEDDEGFDPLEMDRFSQLQQLSRSLTESVSDLTSIHSYLDDVARTSDNLLAQQSRVNTELQEGLMETRLVSFNSIVPRLRRLVRTTSKELDKPVKLEVSGAEGEMDKTVLEGVIAPLEHMLRNSLAHGIESDRKNANKHLQGSINIDVRREATEVVISISDDGAGINRQKVKKLALEKGLIKKGANLTDENIDRLILNSGFTTADEVSKLAGRGVGMDVVGNQINLLGGTLDIKSTPNKGTTFSIRLPYTLALSTALLVEIAETVYAIPVSGLEGIIRMSYPDYQQKVKDKDFIYEYANENYQMQELNTLLDIESETIIENDQIPLVMIRSGDNGVALRVDNIIGSREIVVKTVGSQISSVPGIFGATVLGDGNVVLILDIIPLSRAYTEKLINLDDSAQVIKIEEIEKDPIVMIVDDSITMRKVGERILRRNDYDVTTAKDGLDALEQLGEIIPDVMLLDIEMPRMDGYELAIEMKKEEKYANIPIIMITSRTGEKHRQKAMDLGVDRYLGKPYQEADLLENISELIESSNS